MKGGFVVDGGIIAVRFLGILEKVGGGGDGFDAEGAVAVFGFGGCHAIYLLDKVRVI